MICSSIQPRCSTPTGQRPAWNCRQPTANSRGPAEVGLGVCAAGGARVGPLLSLYLAIGSLPFKKCIRSLTEIKVGMHMIKKAEYGPEGKKNIQYVCLSPFNSHPSPKGAHC